MQAEGKKKTIYILSFIALMCLIVTYGMFFLLRDSSLIRLTGEDGIIETSGALCFFVAAVVAFVLFFKVKTGNDLYLFRTRRNIFFIIIGFLFLFAFGEEISWGQRIFGFSTPEILKSINTQDEANIHNLSIFRLISMNRLFSFFWFGYCVLLPFGKYVSRRLTHILTRINLPVLSISIGSLFLVNYVASRVVYFYKSVGLHNAIIEMKEFNFGVLFMVGIISFANIFLKGIASKRPG